MEYRQRRSQTTKSTARARYRIKPRFFIFCALALVLVSYGIWKGISLFLPDRVQWGRLDTDQAIQLMVVRDETVYKGEEYARVSCIAAEGEMVKAGDPIAMLYKSGYSDRDLQNLITLQQRIKDYQEHNILADLVDKDLNNLNSQINGKLEEIRQKSVEGKTTDLLVNERELKTLMTQRKDYMKEKVPPDDYLNELYSQETVLQNKIDQTRTVVSAPQDGLISFLFDGGETTLSVANLGALKVSDVEQMDKQIDKPVTQSSGVVGTNQPLYRIVNPAKWYALVILPRRESTLSQGAVCEVTLDGSDQVYNASVQSISQDGNRVLAVLAFDQGTEQVVNLRRLSGHIGRSANGFKVPAYAVKQQQDGSVTVAVLDSQGQRQDVPVNVLAVDSRYAIVAEVEGSGGILAVKQQVVKG